MRCLILAACLGHVMAVAASAQDATPKRLPAVKRALDKAEATIVRNRKAYDEANEKAFAEAEKELLKEAERLSKAGKPEEAVAVKKLATSFRGQALISAEKKFAPPNPAQAGAVEWNGHKYKYFPEALTWRDAKKRCEEMGGHLLVIDDEAENTFIFQSMTAMPAGPKEILIGVYRDESTRQWRTVLGEEARFSKWARDEPSGDGECMLMWLRFREPQNGFWLDYLTNTSGSYICEWDD